MISELKEKIKYYANDIFILFVILLSALLVAGGIRLYHVRQKPYSIRLEKQAFSLPSQTKATNIMRYVVSKNSTRYYPITCSAVHRIKEENKIFFANEQDAQKAGFTRSASC